MWCGRDSLLPPAAGVANSPPIRRRGSDLHCLRWLFSSTCSPHRRPRGGRGLERSRGSVVVTKHQLITFVRRVGCCFRFPGALPVHPWSPFPRSRARSSRIADHHCPGPLLSSMLHRRPAVPVVHSGVPAAVVVRLDAAAAPGPLLCWVVWTRRGGWCLLLAGHRLHACGHAPGPKPVAPSP